MKLKNPIALVIAWLGLAAGSAQLAHAAAGSRPVQSVTTQTTLIGTVTNSAAGRAFEGARAVLQGTGRETITDRQGVCQFADVPPGSVALLVSYTGFNTLDVPVVASSGTPIRRDMRLTADVYTLSKFVVSGKHGGNAQAITLQRQSDGVKNIISADTFGGLAGNPAKLLVRMPGVDGETAAGDERAIRRPLLLAEYLSGATASWASIRPPASTMTILPSPWLTVRLRQSFRAIPTCLFPKSSRRGTTVSALPPGGHEAD